MRAQTELRQRFAAYGAQVLLRTNHPQIMPALLARLPLGSELVPDNPGAAADHSFSIDFSAKRDLPFTLRRNGRRVAACQDESALLEEFERVVTWRVSQAARDRVFLHCGVVASRGQAILIPGRSCFGKTTLVTRFLEAGAEYYSDEFALLDSDGNVHPFARPLQIRFQPGSLRQTVVPVGALGVGAVAEREAIQPVLMLACRYRKGARWSPAELTPGAAMLELIRFCFTAFKSPENAFHATGKTASRLKAWRGLRDEAEPVVEWTIRYLDGA